jgi:hypothetical protein
VEQRDLLVEVVPDSLLELQVVVDHAVVAGPVLVRQPVPLLVMPLALLRQLARVVALRAL